MFFKNAIQIICSGLFQWVLFLVLVGGGGVERGALLVKTLHDRSKKIKLFHINFHIDQTVTSPNWIRDLPLEGLFPTRGKVRILVLYRHMPSTCMCPQCYSTLGTCLRIWPCNSEVFSSSCNWFQCIQDEITRKYAKYPRTALNLKERVQPLNKWS